MGRPSAQGKQCLPFPRIKRKQKKRCGELRKENLSKEGDSDRLGVIDQTRWRGDARNSSKSKKRAYALAREKSKFALRFGQGGIALLWKAPSETLLRRAEQGRGENGSLSCEGKEGRGSARRGEEGERRLFRSHPETTRQKDKTGNRSTSLESWESSGKGGKTCLWKKKGERGGSFDK